MNLLVAIVLITISTPVNAQPDNIYATVKVATYQNQVKIIPLDKKF